MKHGMLPQRPVRTPTTPSWLRLWKNGPSSCSPDCCLVYIRLWKRLTADSVRQIRTMYPGNEEKIRKMAIIYDGQVKMAHLAIAAGYSVNGVAALHTEILEKQ